MTMNIPRNCNQTLNNTINTPRYPQKMVLKLQKREFLLKWLSHLKQSPPSGPQAPTTIDLSVGIVAFESSFSKPLISSALPQGLWAWQQLLPICSQTPPPPWRSNRLETEWWSMLQNDHLKPSAVHDGEGHSAAKARKQPCLSCNAADPLITKCANYETHNRCYNRFYIFTSKGWGFYYCAPHDWQNKTERVNQKLSRDWTVRTVQ